MLSRQINELIRPLRKQRFSAFVVGALSILFGLIPPYLMGLLIDDLNDHYGSNAYFIIGSIFSALILYFFLDWYQSYLWHRIVYKGSGIVKSFLFENILHKDHDFFMEHPIGDINNKIINDSFMYTENKILMAPVVLLNVLHIAVIFTILKFISITMGIATVIFSIIFFLLYAHINKYLRKTLAQSREAFSGMMNTANETLLGAEAIQLYSVESFFAKRFEKSVEKYEKLHIKHGFFKTLAKTVTPALTGLITITAILAGIFFWVIGDVSIGGIVAFYMFLPRLSEPVKNLTEFNIVFQSAKAVEGRLEELLYNEEAVNKDLEKIERIDSLELRNVGFKYPDYDEMVLQNINVRVERGEALAITGASGSGKTTLLKLLKRRLVPTTGAILLNDKNYVDIDEDSYISRISVSAQDVFIFESTLHDNICFGHNYPEKLVRDSAILSVIDHFSMDDDAHGLSGGEKQRIGLARALACEHDILILDEPTSELDEETELKIIENLKKVLAETNCIMIVVSHSANVLEKLCTKTLKLN